MKNRLTKAAISATAGLLALSLAACGGSGSKPAGSASGGSGGSGGPAAPSGSASGSVPAAPRKAVPAAYDNAKGWEIPERTTFGKLADPVFAPTTGLLLELDDPDPNTDPVVSIVAHDAKTGAVRWSSKPLTLPKRGTTDVPPRILVTHKDGKEYAVLARTGVQGGDGVNNGSSVTQLAVYDVTSSGDQIAALRDVTVPVFATDGYSALQDGGTVAVMADQDGGATVDVTTGQITSYDGQSALLKAPGPCSETRCSPHAILAGQTPVGPLVLGKDSFWTNGWTSTSVNPDSAQAAPHAFGAPNGDVVAAWSAGFSAGSALWAVHDGRTGKVLASVQCRKDSSSGVSAPPAVSATPDGRFLVAEFVVFDLQTKQGRCFAATSARKDINVTTVDPDGTAYGVADGGTATSIVLASDQATALPDGAAAPDLIGDGVAVYRVATTGPLLIYPHR